MVKLRRPSGLKKIQRKQKPSKRLSIQKLREKLSKRKDENINEHYNDDNDEETTYTMRSIDSDDDQDNSQDEFIDEEYEILSTKETLIEIFTEKV
jgi:hypothetical protein